MQSFLSGMGLGMSLIIAIGAQNIWVLSQSMAGANRLAIALTCILCDAVLIFLGVFTASEIKTWIPGLIPWLTWAGVAFLLYLAFGAAKRAYEGSSGLTLHAEKAAKAWWKTSLAALAISLLNPHVYLDTVVLLGSIGALQPEPLVFALGATTGSVLWFGSLVLFSPALKKLLKSPLRWRIFDSIIAVALCAIAWQLYNTPAG
ncbi:LysE/ArgO family amino acid transporter [Alteromonas sp. RKMC-009]|uniref:LysE/ArgO family amino acid transporter n=1 Tax=Alteromonas sp. RKMC-009 TaxID=2267264 RepID=UPI001E465966|nr:LysE family transporter [Alteromonas sp. RKMC-009]